MEKLRILSDAAKYDVACTSSGTNRAGVKGGIGNSVACGLCHSFAADGRCISLLKILLTNYCEYDCRYCVNRRSNDVPRAQFTPREIAELTINFYKRNYIEGLFLSSALLKSPDHTSLLMYEAIRIVRQEYKFNGYIHCKAIPGASPEVVNMLGSVADRMSVNIELPSEASLNTLAPNKSKSSILTPMGQIRDAIAVNKHELTVYRHSPRFAPAGQSTQMIVGASPDTDFQIMRLSEGLYNRYKLRRVFYSAYMPVAEHPDLPANLTAPPLLREHRLYQADWLLRFYGFKAEELLSDDRPSLDLRLDPKCDWALRHFDQFPVEINHADYEALLRVPGIGVRGANKIITARRASKLDFMDLKKLGIVLKRARYFITCKGRAEQTLLINPETALQSLLDGGYAAQQLSIFDLPKQEEVVKCLTGEI